MYVYTYNYKIYKMYINFKLQIGSQVFLNMCVYISTCIYVCIEQQKILSFKIASTVIIFKKLIIFPEEEFTDPLLEGILSELSERRRLGPLVQYSFVLIIPQCYP